MRKRFVDDRSWIRYGVDGHKLELTSNANSKSGTTGEDGGRRRMQTFRRIPEAKSVRLGQLSKFWVRKAAIIDAQSYHSFKDDEKLRIGDSIGSFRCHCRIALSDCGFCSFSKKNRDPLKWNFKNLGRMRFLKVEQP